MKKILTFGFLALFLAGMVSAVEDPTGFWVEKSVVVTGDWLWDGDAWQLGEFPTTTFDYTAESPSATDGFFGQIEGLGQPWKYDLDMNMQSNADTIAHTELDIWTVNDPATTPATGGYTQYSYTEQNEGPFSQSTLSVHGYGAAFVGSHVEFDGTAWQRSVVDIN